MEQNQDSSLFGLSIDPIAKGHLSEAARWAKFLAIIGFICCGLAVLVGVFSGTVLSSVRNDYGSSPGLGAMGTGFLTFIYLMIAVVYFFPCLFLYRFAVKMKPALAANDQELLNSSFQNLKVMFRYVGILTIIVLAIYLLVILVVLAGMGAGRV